MHRSVGSEQRLLIAFAVVLLGCDGAGAGPALSSGDSVAIAGVQAEYVRAWLADDTTGVLATFDNEATLLPPGKLPVQGRNAIRAYWWPNDGSHTRITAFTWDVSEVLGGGNLAVARGLSTVSWIYTKDGTESASTVRNLGLTVLARGTDGQWRIVRQMWGPGLP